MRSFYNWLTRHAVCILSILASQRDPSLAADYPLAAIYSFQYACEKRLHRSQAL